MTYHLHPTYAVSRIIVREAPFLLSRVAWGYFEVTMKIEFQPATGLGTKTLYHMLEFDGNGHTESILLQVADVKDRKAVAKTLAKQIEFNAKNKR